MSGTKAGAPKLRATMIAKYGSEEAWKAHQAEIGKRGGEKGRNGGWASDKIGKDGLTGRERARVMGKKGGQVSKRSK